jgi:hypothetical protein
MTSEVPANLCLRCGHMCDLASQITDSGAVKEARPTPGAIAICIRCGHVMAFDQALRFRELSRAEGRQVERDPIITTTRDVIAKHSSPLPKGNPS